MEKEIWKVVPGYEGLYQVSNLGRVRSLDAERRKGRGIGTFIRKGKVIKPRTNKGGYYRVNLYKNNKMLVKPVHQLVAMAFLGHVPCGSSLHVHHEDEVKTNNKLINLRIVTARENVVLSKKGGSSKYVGVSWSKQNKKWASEICINGKRFHLGYFTNEIDAHNAYQNKLKEI